MTKGSSRQESGYRGRKRRQLNLSVSAQELLAISEIAQELDVATATLVKNWVVERLEKEQKGQRKKKGRNSQADQL